ncbi:MAG: FAD-dependent oxidoreductase [Firmicutes bacterium]|jgi:glycine/D-amino acid oxidase-like deaminating enzyme|nr:FAD-dependent oxidoreductase [Bacillota bacterium]
MQAVYERGRWIPVHAEADVLVVGGGVAGFAAALAAARRNLSVLIMERYGWLGGLATGGLVTAFEPYDDGEGDRIVGGIAYELARRLVEKGWAVMPGAEWNSTDPRDIKKWKSWASVGWADKRVRLVLNVNPEYMKHECNMMLREAGARTLFHSWVSDVIMDGNRVKGVVFESKSGRRAVLAKVVVDASGDGDVAAWSGAPFVEDKRGTGLVFWVGNVDIDRALEFQYNNPDEFKAKLTGVHGSVYYMRTTCGGIVWFNNRFYSMNELDVDELSKAEIDMRAEIVKAVEAYRREIPGFERADLVQIAPQLGVRLTRILKGRNTVTKASIRERATFPDSIGRAGLDTEYGISFQIPYGALLPEGVGNVIAAGRFVSSDFYAQEYIRLIPACMVTGEAAGTAAALAVRRGVDFAGIDVAELQSELSRSGVII